MRICISYSSPFLSSQWQDWVTIDTLWKSSYPLADWVTCVTSLTDVTVLTVKRLQSCASYSLLTRVGSLVSTQTSEHTAPQMESEHIMCYAYTQLSKPMKEGFKAVVCLTPAILGRLWHHAAALLLYPCVFCLRNNCVAC